VEKREDRAEYADDAHSPTLQPSAILDLDETQRLIFSKPLIAPPINIKPYAALVKTQQERFIYTPNANCTNLDRFTPSGNGSGSEVFAAQYFW
jgi:hypothetical protein